MRYAHSHCTVTESTDTVTFTGPCFITTKPYSVTVKVKELALYRDGVSMQDAFKSLSVDDREFLMSGMSPEGWEQAFGK